MFDMLAVVSLRQVTEYIAFAAVALLFVAVLQGILIYRGLSRGLRLFWYYLIMVLVIELLAKYQGYVLKRDNVYLLPIYTFFEFVILLLFFRETLYLKTEWRRALLWSIALLATLLAVYSLDILFWHSEKVSRPHFQMYSKIFTNSFILFFSVIFFLRFVGGVAAKEGKALFWLYSGLLIYFSGSFVIFMAINELIHTPLSKGIVLWLLNAVLTFLFYGIVNAAFLIYRQTWKRLQPG